MTASREKTPSASVVERDLLDQFLDAFIDATEHAKRTGDVAGAASAFDRCKVPLDAFVRAAMLRRRAERGIA